MKNLILIILLSLLAINLLGEKITDDLWLKAVQLKSESMNAYPTKTQYISQTKDKKGNVEEEETIIISHQENNGQIINSFLEGTNSKGNLTEEDESVKRYLSMSAISEDEGMFKTETSEDFTLKRLDNEMIEGKDYAKYKVNSKAKSDDGVVDSEGFIWLDSNSGAPFKMTLDVDPHKMVIKKLTVNTLYSLSQAGFLQTDKIVTDIVISIVLKKMYITQTILRENYLQLNQ